MYDCERVRVRSHINKRFLIYGKSRAFYALGDYQSLISEAEDRLSSDLYPDLFVEILCIAAKYHLSSRFDRADAVSNIYSRAGKSSGLLRYGLFIALRKLAILLDVDSQKDRDCLKQYLEHFLGVLEEVYQLPQKENLNERFRIGLNREDFEECLKIIKEAGRFFYY